MTAPKTEDKATPAAAPAAAPKLVKGKKARLIAVHGLMVHPFTNPEVRFTPGDSRSIEVDDWVLVQVEAGKLVVSED